MSNPRETNVKDGSDRRRAPRYSVSTPNVAFLAFIDKNGHPVAVRVTNIGFRGVGVVVPEALVSSWPTQKDGELLVSLNLDGDTVLNCKGHVVWFGGTISAGKRALYSGVELKYTPEQSKQIRSYLQMLTPDED